MPSPAGEEGMRETGLVVTSNPSPGRFPVPDLHRAKHTNMCGSRPEGGMEGSKSADFPAGLFLEALMQSI